MGQMKLAARSDKLRLSALLEDWRSLAPGLDRLLAADQQITDAQRAAALDLVTVLLPRSARFYTVLTLRPERWLADAARDLAHRSATCSRRSIRTAHWKPLGTQRQPSLGLPAQDQPATRVDPGQPEMSERDPGPDVRGPDRRG